MSLSFAGADPPGQTRVVPVADVSQIGEARRAVAALAFELRFDETAAGRASLVATELASNVARHGGEQGGHLLARAIDNGTGIEVIAIDKGPGMGDLDRVMRDGFSTAGTAGKGLGAVRRMSELFDIYTQPGAGSVVVSRMTGLGGGAPPAADPLDIGAVCTAAPGEQLSGDAWVLLRGERGPMIVVIDGLGHGSAANAAASLAVEIARQVVGAAPAAVLEAMHAGLRATRGAAAAVAEIDDAREQLRFAGIGNIACRVTSTLGSSSLASMNGIVGLEARRIQEFSAAFVQGALLVLHTDGIGTKWRLDQYSGIRNRHPSVAAAVLYRDALRGRDDATAIVARGLRAVAT